MIAIEKNRPYSWSVRQKAVPLHSVFSKKPADMAQLVEQRIRNAWVRGSSPRVGSNDEQFADAYREAYLRLLFSDSA